MTINILVIIVIVVLTSLAYWSNENLNSVPGLKPMVKVVIVGVAILLLLSSIGLIQGSSIVVK